jgi:hypothetical protein
VNADELVELRERVRRVRATLKPLPLPGVETDEVEHFDGQCLRFAAAAVLRVDPDSLPIVSGGADRWDLWRSEMEELGYRIENLALDEIPPSNSQPWVAVIDAGDATHALGLIGLTVLRIDGEHRSTIQPSSVLSAFRLTAAA